MAETSRTFQPHCPMHRGSLRNLFGNIALDTTRPILWHPVYSLKQPTSVVKEGYSLHPESVMIRSVGSLDGSFRLESCFHFPSGINSGDLAEAHFLHNNLTLFPYPLSQEVRDTLVALTLSTLDKSEKELIKTQVGYMSPVCTISPDGISISIDKKPFIFFNDRTMGFVDSLSDTTSHYAEIESNQYKALRNRWRKIRTNEALDFLIDMPTPSSFGLSDMQERRNSYSIRFSRVLAFNVFNKSERVVWVVTINSGVVFDKDDYAQIREAIDPLIGKISAGQADQGIEDDLHRIVKSYINVQYEIVPS